MKQVPPKVTNVKIIGVSQENSKVTATGVTNGRSEGSSGAFCIPLGAVGGFLVQFQLHRLSDSVSGLTVVDPMGYLTDLKSMKATSDAEISDIKKARLLLKSVVWLEAFRLASPNEAKAVIARGVKSIPNSVKLWMQASKLEYDNANRSRVLKKRLKHIPDSVRLWKAVVELFNEEDVRLFLHRAMECCPLHVELWLALARLETCQSAKKVLNRARERLSKKSSIWITAAKLEEANGNTSMVGKIIERGIRALQREGLAIDREAWMKEVEAAQCAKSIATYQALICNTIATRVE